MMSFWGVKKVGRLAVSNNFCVQRVQSMCFWDVVNLIDPLTVGVSFDNDETEIIGRNIFSLQVVC